MGNIVLNKPTINVDQFQLMPDSGSVIPTSLNQNSFNNEGKDIFRYSTLVAQSDDWTFEYNGPFLDLTSGVSLINYAYNIQESDTIIKLADLNFSAPMDSDEGLSRNASYQFQDPPNPFNFLPNGMDVTLTFGNKQEWPFFMIRKKYLFSLQRPLNNQPTTFNSVFLTTQFIRYGGSLYDSNSTLIDATPLVPETRVAFADSYTGVNSLLGGLLNEDCLQLTEYNPTTDTYTFLEPIPNALDFTDIISSNDTQLRLVVKAFPSVDPDNETSIFYTGFRKTPPVYDPPQSNRYTSTNNFKALIRIF